MSRIKLGTAFVFLCVIALVGWITGAWYQIQKDNSAQLEASEAINTGRLSNLFTANRRLSTTISTSDTTTTLQPLKQIQETSQISPDGQKQLILTVTDSKYTLAVEVLAPEEERADPKDIYTGTLSPNEEFSIPFNTWSPDNQFFFIEKTTSNRTDFLLFTASSEEIADDPFINITTLYTGRDHVNSLANVTGWAAKSFLLVQTVNPDSGDSTPSMWFDVYNLKFIQLSSIF
jgi:hypothetical protein